MSQVMTLYWWKYRLVTVQLSRHTSTYWCPRSWHCTGENIDRSRFNSTDPPDIVLMKISIGHGSTLQTHLNVLMSQVTHNGQESRGPHVLSGGQSQVQGVLAAVTQLGAGVGGTQHHEALVQALKDLKQEPNTGSEEGWTVFKRTNVPLLKVDCLCWRNACSLFSRKCYEHL